MRVLDYPIKSGNDGGVGWRVLRVTSWAPWSASIFVGPT